MRDLDSPSATLAASVAVRERYLSAIRDHEAAIAASESGLWSREDVERIGAIEFLKDAVRRETTSLALEPYRAALATTATADLGEVEECHLGLHPDGDCAMCGEDWLPPSDVRGRPPAPASDGRRFDLLAIPRCSADRRCLRPRHHRHSHWAPGAGWFPREEDVS